MPFARILAVMAATAAMVVFGAQNWDNVPVQLIFGPPTRVRLVFLLLIAAGAGYVLAALRSFGRELRLRGELRQLRRQLHAVASAREVGDGRPPRDEGDGEELALAGAPRGTHEQL
jgi:uncharacterized integral membrane protein